MQQDPSVADAYFLLALIAIEHRNFAKAENVISRALRFREDRPEYYAHRAKCFIELNRQQNAREALDKAEALQPSDPLTQDTIGVIYSRLGEHGKAVPFFEQAVAQKPDNASFQYNLASSLQFLGLFERAEQAYEAAIALQPLHYRSHSSLSQLKKQTADNNHLVRLEQSLAQLTDKVDGELHLCHALAKEHEDLGHYAESLQYLHRGNQKKKASLDYDIERDREIFNTLQDLFPAPDDVQEATPTGQLQHPNGYHTEEPIFIVGMPRTGTTLVERILSSHPSVFPAGELSNFSLLTKRQAKTRSALVLDAATLKAATTLDYTVLGKAYLDSTRPRTGHTPHFIDKMPLNFLYVGFIRQALPKAKIICLRRNPMDTCLSNFRQLFATSFSYYNYAYDLQDTAHYYLLFDQLMSHWKNRYGENFYEISYEDLIADPEFQTRKLLDYCQLPWDPTCLAFDQNTAPVATASSVQVREKIYRGALDRWKRYINASDDHSELQKIHAFFLRAGLLTPGEEPNSSN